MKVNKKLHSAGSQETARTIGLAGRFSVAAIVVSTLVSMILTGTMRAQTGIQYSSKSFSVGASPAAVRVGDLDGDGLNDIAVANLDGSLQLLFNGGGGVFQRVSMSGMWPAGCGAIDLDIGDLNADGRNDVALAVATSTGAVSVLLNLGNRQFAAPVNFDLCNSSKGVAIGDLDQDGDNDLADINLCSKSGVLINNGQGGFALGGLYGGGSASRSIVIADLNRDGFKDLAYVNSGVGINGNITVVLNNRNGTFSAPAWYYAGDLPDDLAAADFNGDGITDVAIANSYLSEIILLFSDGYGAFNGYSEMTGADTPTSVVAPDLNGDSRPDLAVASWSTSRLSIFTNQGNYNFSYPAGFNTGQSPVDIAAGKLDGDLLPDLVVANQGSGTITVLFSAGGVSDPPPPPPPPAPITLTASSSKTKTARLVDLRWSGITGSSASIFRNGSLVGTVYNSGSYTDRMGVRTTGTFTYKVCAPGGSACSSDVTIRF